MKKLHVASIALVALLSLGFLACKEDDNLEADLSVQTLAGRYKLTALTQKTAITPEVSIMGKLEPCALDDIYELKSDTTANYIDAGTSCSPSHSYSFNYRITKTAVQLLGAGADLFPGGEVKKFDGKTLVLEGKIKNDYTQNIEVTITGTLVKE